MARDFETHEISSSFSTEGWIEDLKNSGPIGSFFASLLEEKTHSRERGGEMELFKDLKRKARFGLNSHEERDLIEMEDNYGEPD